MQNAMNIIAMVQNTNMTKQKTDVPSKTLGNEKASFNRALSQASKYGSKDSILKSKDEEVNSKRTNENKIEKFAKVMSSNNFKVDIKEKPTVDALEQADTATDNSVITAKIAQEKELIENATLEEPDQAVLEMMQQLIQMVEGLKVEDPLNQKLADLETELQAIVQKLEQVLAMPTTSQSAESVELLNGMKSDLIELVKQLEVVDAEYKLDPKQTEQLVKQFTDKLNQAKTQLDQALQQVENPKYNTELALITKVTVKSESKEISQTDNTALEGKPTDENLQIVATNTDKTSDGKNNKNSDEKSEKDGESPYKASENTEVKQTITGDKLNQEAPKNLVVPQNDKLDFQLNIKQANLNLQKESLVKINKTDIMNQVIKKADIIVQAGYQEIIMKLEPESLGKLNLKLVVENGLITAKFVAESQQVKEVLESNFNKLKDALQEKGISVQSFSVSVGQEGAGFNSGQGLEQWKRAIKFNNKSSGEYIELDEENSFSVNPYNYHEGKVDYKA